MAWAHTFQTTPDVTTDPDCKIRPAEEADASGILRCLSEAFTAYRERHSEQGFTDAVLTPETLKHRMKQMNDLCGSPGE